MATKVHVKRHARNLSMRAIIPKGMAMNGEDFLLIKNGIRAGGPAGSAANDLIDAMRGQDYQAQKDARENLLFELSHADPESVSAWTRKQVPSILKERKEKAELRRESGIESELIERYKAMAPWQQKRALKLVEKKLLMGPDAIDQRNYSRLYTELVKLAKKPTRKISLTLDIQPQLNSPEKQTEREQAFEQRFH